MLSISSSSSGLTYLNEYTATLRDDISAARSALPHIVPTAITATSRPSRSISPRPGSNISKGVSRHSTPSPVPRG